MAATVMANVIDIPLFDRWTAERTIYQSKFFKSNAIQLNSGLSGMLGGSGMLMTAPFFKDISGATGDVPSETVAATVNNLTTGSQVVRRQVREKVWGANALSGIISGSDPMGEIVRQTNNFWDQSNDQLAILTLKGVIADNIANDAGDLVNDISGGVGNAAIISATAIIDAQAKLGENGASSSGDLNGGDFDTIAMHPLTYALLRKQNLIDFEAISDQGKPIASYGGMVVVQDRNMPVSAGVYDTFIIKKGALQYGTSSNGILTSELFRDPSKGMGIDSIYTRRQFAIHPVGFKWTENTVTNGVTPSDANLILAANWDRVYNAENSKIVVVRHKIA
jgi:hypothetical protein